MRIIFDFTDLVEFLRDRPLPAGMQRVQIDVCLQLAKRSDVEVIPVCFSELSKRYYRVDVERILKRDQRYLASLRPIRPSGMIKILRRVHRLWSVRLQPGDLVFVPGAGWVSRRKIKYLFEIQKIGNIRFAWTFYDLIPISHPEFATEENAREFKLWIDAALSLQGLFVCISEFSRGQLLEYAASKGQPVNAVTVPLAHEFSAPASRIRADLLYLKNERFVLCVGTIEIRKNHLALVQIWETLHREMGRDTPILVLIGARGWLNDRVFKFLEATNYVHGQVIHVHDADDAELAWLYQNCEFTVFPSMLEGWGLPVGESLWCGKPCICYRHSSLPEVGGGHVVYCDAPGYAALEVAIRKALNGRFSALPPPRSELRTWQSVGEELLDALMNHSRAND